MKKTKRKTRTNPSYYGINAADYDCASELTLAERSALGIFISRNRQTVTSYPEIVSCNDLGRIVSPILDIFELNEVTAKNKIPYAIKCHALMFLLKEISRRQSLYWAWKEADWAEILCISTDHFQEKYRSTSTCRRCVVNIAYYVGGFTNFYLTGNFERYDHAINFFGKAAVDISLARIVRQLKDWGFSSSGMQIVSKAACELMVYNRSPHLEDITREQLLELNIPSKKRFKDGPILKHTFIINGTALLADVLTALGIIHEPVPRKLRTHQSRSRNKGTGEWEEWSKIWVRTSTLQPSTVRSTIQVVRVAGRWLMKEHPEITNPAQWTTHIAAEFVALVAKAKIGQWAIYHCSMEKGKKFSPSTISSYLSCLRRFFRDLQDWELIPRRFNPRRALAAPRGITGQIKHTPRVIDDFVWVKLLHAGLNLTAEDLLNTDSRRQAKYPLEMVRALAIVWLFCGLRNDEIIRLRLGCTRRQVNRSKRGKLEIVSKDSLTFLEVPANKTSGNFIKPVDALVGKEISAWERIRPRSEMEMDPKAGEKVNYLFTYRLRRLGRPFINKNLIPLLCRKAGIPTSDSRGPITSHRARATIASKLANAEVPMSIFHLKGWLGHSHLESTMHYVKRSEEKLARSYEAADYLSNNLRQLSALITTETENRTQETHEKSVAGKLLQIKESLLTVRRGLSLSKEEEVTLDKNISQLEELYSLLKK